MQSRTTRGRPFSIMYPSGRYSLQLWQESLGTVTQDVTVKDEAITAVTVDMSKK